MAIPQAEAPQVEPVNGQIAQTVSPFSLHFSSQAGDQMEELGNLADRLGTKLFRDEEINRATQQAYEDAQSGKFRSVFGISDADKVYNQIGASVLTAQGTAQLDRAKDQLETSPNYNPQLATEQYAQIAKGLVDQTQQSQNIPSDLKAKVGIAMQQKALANGTEVYDTAHKIMKNVDTMNALNSAQELQNQGVQALRKGDVTLAGKMAVGVDGIINGLVSTGSIGAMAAKEMHTNFQTEMDATRASVTGDYNGLSNEALLKALQFNRENNLKIETDQFNHNVSYGKYLFELQTKGTATLPSDVVLTKPQEAEAQLALAKYKYRSEEQAQRETQAINNAKLFGNFRNLINKLTPEQQQDFYGISGTDSSLPDDLKQPAKLFQGLPGKIQGAIMGAVNRDIALIKKDPIHALGLENQPVQYQASSLIARGFPLNKLVTPIDFVQYQSAYNANPVQTLSDIHAKYGDFTQATGLIPRLAKATGTMGLHLADEGNLGKDYMLGLSLKNAPGKQLTLKNMDSDMKDTFIHLPTDTMNVLRDYAQVTSKARMDETPEEILKDQFSFANGNLIKHDDNDVLNGNLRPIAQTLTPKGGDAVKIQEQLSNARFLYNPITKNYDIFTNSGKSAGTITPNELQEARTLSNSNPDNKLVKQMSETRFAVGGM